jgi:hypothetical protein
MEIYGNLIEKYEKQIENIQQNKRNEITYLKENQEKTIEIKVAIFIVERKMISTKKKLYN